MALRAKHTCVEVLVEDRLNLAFNDQPLCWENTLDEGLRKDIHRRVEEGIDAYRFGGTVNISIHDYENCPAEDIKVLADTAIQEEH